MSIFKYMKINNLLVKRALLKEELEHYYNEKSKRKEYGQKWIHATFNLKQELVFFKNMFVLYVRIQIHVRWSQQPCWVDVKGKWTVLGLATGYDDKTTAGDMDKSMCIYI